MENFCNFIINPAWWSVIATFIAAIVAAVITCHIGKQQNRLQEYQNELQRQQLGLQEQQNKLQKAQTDLMRQQIKSQDYEIYRGLYELIFSIQKKYREFVTSVFIKLASDENLEIYTWNEISQEIIALKEQVEDKSSDMNLKFSQDSHRFETSKTLLILMTCIIDDLERIERQSYLSVPNVANIKELIENIDRGEEYMKLLIASYITDDNQRDKIMASFTSIKELYESVDYANLLEIIKEKI